jgi:hypothetical protein
MVPRANPWTVTFPDGETVGSDEEAVHAGLSGRIGREAKLPPPGTRHECV